MSQLPFQLLELNIISGQDLAPVSRKNLRTYAIAWINPDRKLRTRTDQQGKNNPTWNDKFVFRVDDKFLSSDTSAVMIEIYAVGWLRDIPVGSVRVLISNLLPPALRGRKKPSQRFIALQIRRASGRPQGILNVGVSLLDSSMKSMPLYTELSASAFGYYNLMGDNNDHGRKMKDPHNGSVGNKTDQKQQELGEEAPIIILRRTKSDQTDLGNLKNQYDACTNNGSVVINPGSSIVNGGSNVNGGGSNVNGGGSIVNGGGSIVNGGGSSSVVDIRPNDNNFMGGSMCNSDVGPSASIVAAAVARGLYPVPTPVPPKPGSSILEDWTLEGSSINGEGLQSKIDRWKMELPPSYEKLGYRPASSTSSKLVRRRRRHTDDGSGVFSCFGSAFGCEFSIVCGANDGKKNKRSGNKNLFTPSELDL